MNSRCLTQVRETVRRAGSLVQRPVHRSQKPQVSGYDLGQAYKSTYLISELKTTWMTGSLPACKHSNQQAATNKEAIESLRICMNIVGLSYTQPNK